MATQIGPLADIERRLDRVLQGQDEHSASLRVIGDKLDRLIEILTPKEMDGPTLDEILAMLVSQIAQQGVLLRRIDGRTEVIQEHLGIVPTDAIQSDGDSSVLAADHAVVGVNGSGSRS